MDSVFSSRHRAKILVEKSCSAVLEQDCISPVFLAVTQDPRRNISLIVKRWLNTNARYCMSTKENVE